MLIRNEVHIEFELPESTPMVALLQLHPSLAGDVRSGDLLRVMQVNEVGDAGDFPVPTTEYIDCFGNQCTRFTAPMGKLRLMSQCVLACPDVMDPQPEDAMQWPIDQLPNDILQYLLASRYCEVDRMGGIAYDLFSWSKPGWERAAAIRDWVHNHVRFDYQKARSTKTALDVFTEREGVCRDFQHLAVTLTRAMNIPARYVTGYLGDIRVPYGGTGDFSAWYQVYLDGRWWNMDARHNEPRYGRILMAVGRDAADVAITTSFGKANLTHFYVDSSEVDVEGNLIPVEGRPESASRALGPRAVPSRAA